MVWTRSSWRGGSRLQQGQGLWAAGKIQQLCLVPFPLFQVGNLGLLFVLLFFIFAALGVELFGDLGELGLGRAEGLGLEAEGPWTHWSLSSPSLLPQSVMRHTPVRAWAGMPPSGTLAWPS